MRETSVTLPIAYMIETLRSNGVSNEELLIQIKQKDISPWEELKSPFDFDELVKLYDQNQNTFNSIILDGYTVKFVTMRGLQTLLKLRFDKMSERDYQLTNKGITRLRMEEHQLTTLKQMLSRNWIISESDSQNNIQESIEISILLT